MSTHYRATTTFLLAALVGATITASMAEESCDSNPEGNPATGSSMMQVESWAKGREAPLNEAGYKAVAKMKSNQEMEAFVKRVIADRGLHIVDAGSLTGVVPYYNGKKATQSFKALSNELTRAVNKKHKPWLISKDEARKIEAKKNSKKKAISITSTKPKTSKAISDKSLKTKVMKAISKMQLSPPGASMHLLDTRTCLAPGLQEAHLQAIRNYAMLLATGKISVPAAVTKVGKHQQPSLEDLPTTAAPISPTEAPDSSTPSDSTAGSSATLDAAGFKSATALCCPQEMEIFFTRLLAFKGFDVCSVPHVQGLMHWFSCVPEMDFQHMLDVIDNGNPCKYWSPGGVTCPALSSECAGTYCR